MSKSDNKFYKIPARVMRENIALDELNDVLDKIIDKEEVTDDEEELIVMYALQHMYRSGKRRTCTEEVHEKFENLITDRRRDLLTALGMAEEYIDADGNIICELKDGY